MSAPATPEQASTTLPRPARGRVAGLRPATVALLAALVAAGVAIGLDGWFRQTAIEVIRGETVGRLSPRRAALENAINERMAVLRGVAAHVAVHWGQPGLPEDFDAYAALIGREESIGVRTIQYVVDGIVTHTWPLEGNESAIGRNLRDDPRSEISGDYAAATRGGGIVLSGPTELYQGGSGLIGRLRAPIPDPSVEVVAAVVLDFPLILRISELDSETALAWRLRDATGRTVAGVDSLDGDLGGPVGLRVSLPDREWELEATPAGGWSSLLASRQVPVRLGLGGLVLVTALIAWTLQARRISQRDAELAAERFHAEQKFRILFEVVPDGVVLARASDGVILEVNEAYARMVRRSRAELLGSSSAELGIWASAREREATVALLRERGECHEVRFGIRLPDGTRREGIVSGTRAEVDGITCHLCVVRDVHDRWQMEQRLAEGQRLEAIGRLAGGIAHDFNNLITGIAGYADLVRQGLPPDDARQADLAEIARAAARAAELTRQLLTFARRQVTAPRVVDLAALVRESHGLLRQLLGESITLVLELPEAPAPVLIDPAQCEQVITNLAINARDAMPDGGLVVIGVAEAGGGVELTVTDTGTGIEAAHLPVLFEPFFTTKAPGAGTGLGLAMVHGIVEQAGGAIGVETELGEGTTFRVRLPRASGAVETPGTPTVGSAAPGGSEVILVAEDEPQVRALVARVLGRLGYSVLTADDGTEALALAASHHGPLDLLLTDMVMPRMGGGELVRRLQVLHPELRVLLMSGYSEELVAEEHADVPFLPKPFTPEELASAVRAVLDR